MFCPMCGCEVQEQQRFCHKCGADMLAEDPGRQGRSGSQKTGGSGRQGQGGTQRPVGGYVRQGQGGTQKPAGGSGRQGQSGTQRPTGGSGRQGQGGTQRPTGSFGNIGKGTRNTRQNNQKIDKNKILTISLFIAAGVIVLLTVLFKIGVFSHTDRTASANQKKEERVIEKNDKSAGKSDSDDRTTEQTDPVAAAAQKDQESASEPADTEREAVSETEKEEQETVTATKKDSDIASSEKEEQFSSESGENTNPSENHPESPEQNSQTNQQDAPENTAPASTEEKKQETSDDQGDTRGEYFRKKPNAEKAYVYEDGTYDSERLVTVFNDIRMKSLGDTKKATAPDGDKHTWIRVEIPKGEMTGWVRGDLVTDDGNGSFKVKEGTNINLRSQPTYYSDIAVNLNAKISLSMTGESASGKGSDGKDHQWYRVKNKKKVTGWVRYDMIKTETSGQQSESENQNNKPTEAEPAQTEESAAAINWQQVYYDYLMANYTAEEYPPTFGLCYIDGDDIPELAVGFNGTSRFEQVALFCIYNGKVTKLGDIGWFSSFSFISGQNLICNHVPVGAMSEHILVQKIDNGQLVTVYDMERGPGSNDSDMQYQMGESHEKYVSCTEEEWMRKYSEFFPDGSLSYTPDVMMDDYSYRCSFDGLDIILTNPEAVTF